MKKGFTLIETLVYIGIVGGFITFFILTAYQIIDFSERLEKQRELGENQRFLVQKLHWVLSGATVSVPAQGSSGAVLTVTKTGVGQITVDSLAGAARLKIGAGDAVLLTNDYASTTNLLFEHLNFSGKSAVRARADLANDVATTSIDTTIIIK